MQWCGFLRCQTVFHQPNVDAAAAHSLGIFFLSCAMDIAQCHGMETVNGKVVFSDQVTLDRLG